DSNGANESAGNRWKKFYVDYRTTMSITYNTVPGTPANLSPHQGQVACGGVIGTTTPVLQAQYVDADTADNLTSTFQWQQLPSGAVTSVPGPSKPANSNGAVTVALGSAAEGKEYQFRVQTADGTDASPWSPWCTFKVDTTAPPAPVVTPTASGTAPVYTPCDPGNINACTPRGGPGVGGGFVFSEPAGPDGQDVVKYVYGWDAPELSVTVTAGAATPTIMLTPPHYGINKLTVYSVDDAGRSSPTTVYNILVGAPSAAVAHWPLDSINGHGLTDSVSGSSLTATGVTWTSGARYVGADAATFTGTGRAYQSAPVDTAGSFSIAVSVRPAATLCTNPATYTVMSMDSTAVPNSTSGSAFKLSFDCVNRKWEFKLADSAQLNAYTSVTTSSGTALLAQWTMLVASYDEAQNTMRIWQDGVMAGTATPLATWVSAHGTGWTAGGPVVLGSARSLGAETAWFSGEIADARAWNRALVADDLTGTNANPAAGVPAQAGLTQPLEVGSWQFPDGECYCGDTPDGSVFARKATLSPNWTLDPGWNGDPATTPAWLTNDSHDGNGGVQLNGTTGYISTRDDKGTLSTADDVERPVLRTDQSYTLSGWVRISDKTVSRTVFSQQGTRGAAFAVRYDRAVDRWSFAVTGSDVDAPVVAKVNSIATAQLNGWVFLEAIYDGPLGKIRLFVDSQLQGEATVTASWNATGSFNIGRTLQAGAGAEFFAGTIDDVRVYAGTRRSTNSAVPANTLMLLRSGLAGKCLNNTAGASTDGNPVTSSACNGDYNAQLWTMHTDNTIRIAGKCLNAKNAGTTPGTPVELGTCTGTVTQQWQTGPYNSLRNSASDLCLDVWNGDTTDGTRLQLWDCYGNAAQAWTPRWTGIGMIRSGIPGKCINNNMGARTNGNPIQSYDCNGGADAQIFTLLGDGTVRIAGMCLDVVNHATVYGSKVQLYTCTLTPNQIWEAGPNHSLRNPVSGLCLDVPSTSTVNGTQLQIYDCYGNQAQEWFLP
ncbi:ricin-type beta-trefoil lectin domain protein, partial [Dactylosporangium sp. NPDC000521]|uniref:ricin-type beta-trefoil lectin domain protein n=1 Tax=Dactylosporangium sp. NPDC000521 TaxID=3363975 RepID=UPI0036C9A7A4